MAHMSVPPNGISIGSAVLGQPTLAAAPGWFIHIRHDTPMCIIIDPSIHTFKWSAEKQVYDFQLLIISATLSCLQLFF